MLTTKYKSLSTSESIVFTCFFISLLSFVTNTAFSQSEVHYKDDYVISGSSQMKLSKQQAIQEDVRIFLQNRILSTSPDSILGDLRIIVREIDDRISIPHCDSPYRFDTNSKPTQQSNMSVKVSCNSTSWYLFVHANVSVIQEVVVTSDNLSPGTLLNKSNLKVIEVDKNRLRGSTFASIDDVIGARIKRRVRAGNIVDDRMLCFICKGDRVTIAAISSGLSVKVYGVAEEDGVLGDTIQVRNLSSDKLVFAVIASTSQVEINI